MQLSYRTFLQVALTLLLSITLVACGGGERAPERRTAEQQPDTTAQQSAAGEATTTVQVVARDFEFSLDANQAPAGQTTFVIHNEGSMPHDFAITVNGERHQSEMISPGNSASLTVNLPAGDYPYICTVPGHDILGMKGTFTAN